MLAALALGLAPTARAQTLEHADDHKAAAPTKKAAGAKGKKADKAAKGKKADKAGKKETKSGMVTGPAPNSGSMPTGPAPRGRLGTEPSGKGKLGTDPVPGEGRSRPPRPN